MLHYISPSLEFKREKKRKKCSRSLHICLYMREWTSMIYFHMVVQTQQPLSK